MPGTSTEPEVEFGVCAERNRQLLTHKAEHLEPRSPEGRLWINVFLVHQKTSNYQEIKSEQAESHGKLRSRVQDDFGFWFGDNTADIL